MPICLEQRGWLIMMVGGAEMGKFSRIVATGLTAAIMAPAAAYADSVQETLAGFGLLGQWAQQCGAPASGDNAYATYSMVSDREAQLRYDFGPEYQPRTWTIYFVQRVDSAPDELRIDASLPDGTHAEMIIEMQNNAIKNISSVEGDGTICIKNGVMTLNGKEAPWLARCN